MNTAKIAIVSIHFVEETVWDRHFFKVAIYDLSDRLWPAVWELKVAN